MTTSAVIKGYDNDPDNPAKASLSRSMIELAVEKGIFKTKFEATRAIREIGLALASADLVARKPGKDVQAGQAVRMLDDLNKVIERLGQRIREWFLALYPERRDQMLDPDSIEDRDDPQYHAIITELYRKNLEVIHHVLTTEAALPDSEAPDPTLGALRSMANELLGLFRERDKLETYIKDTVSEAAPVLTEVAGPIIAARLISESGTLLKLAMRSSTTIQILGARKAIFRHLRHGGRPPKHGIIFVHPAVSQSKGHQRGKAAKMLAAIIIRAARTDAFGGSLSAKKLLADLDKAIEDVRSRPQPDTEAEPRRGARSKPDRERRPGSRERRRIERRDQKR